MAENEAPQAEQDQQESRSSSRRRSRSRSRDQEVTREVGENSSVATAEQNDALEHSESGTHSRNDALDQGVPMQQGSPDEPVGPEDALGEGPKRGDYSGRQPEGTTHLESVSAPDGGESVTDDDGNVVDRKPTSVLREQNSRVEDQGDVEGKKGGVETAGERA